jgi:hypothetical protein
MKITDSFEYNGKKQNFKRDSYATLAEMKAVAESKIPDIFTATCAETGKLYIFNINNEVDETLGKWREAGGSDFEEETDTIDFSTWPEFDPDLEAGGITLDGQGGANVDGSNVGVDPDDIEPDEP